jgi:hypothetical protein
VTATFPLPSRVRALRVGSRPHTLAVSALGILHRELYDSYPNVRGFLGDRLELTVDAFVEHVVHTGHDMGWTLHFEFGAFCELPDTALWDEICTGVARRWVRLDMSPAAWIAVTCAHSPESVVFGVRSRSIDDGPKIVRARVERCPEHVPPFRYQTGSRPDLALSARWIHYAPLVCPPSRHQPGAS